jgi:Mg-chelatase subunit ChlI
MIMCAQYPCKPLLIATLNQDDSELADTFLDRIGIALNTDTEPLSTDERVDGELASPPATCGALD